MIPVIITMDLEIAYDHNMNDQRIVLNKLNKDLSKNRIPITIFTTSEAATEFQVEVTDLKYSGNEIACHGYNHCTGENYRKMQEKHVSKCIIDSTINIENIIQDKLNSFRGPGFSTSAFTQNILINNGYKSDFSICSQRIDFFNSAGGNIKWLCSPRKPYHPAKNDPYKKGSLPLWVIPLSSIGLPFISGLLYLFGLNFMKYYFLLLLKESYRTMKPIVYLFHSYEFSQFTGNNNFVNDSERVSQKWFHKYYGSDINKKYNNNLKLIEYIFSFNETKPFTSLMYTEYLDRLT